MAVFKLGALVTEIVGSIGGTTFKRQGSSRVMMKKSNGASKSSLYQNPRLGGNSVIFKKWSTLSPSTKTAWRSIAASNKVLDRFGNSVNISGVAFQRRCDLNVIFLNEVPNPFTFSAVLNSASFAAVPEIDWDNSTFEVTFNLPEGDTKIALMLEYSLQPLPAPIFISRGVFFFGLFEDGVTRDCYDEFFARFGIYENAYNFRLYAYVYSESGLVGTTIQSDVLDF